MTAEDRFMNRNGTARPRGASWTVALAGMAAWLLHMPVQAAGNVTVNVVDGAGAPVSGFR